MAKRRNHGNRPGPSNQVTQVVKRTTEAFSGPIPHPDILQKYDLLVPGAAAQLIKMAQEEAIHRRAMESKQLDSDIDDRKRARAEARLGQIFGFGIGIAALGAGLIAALNGAEWFGTFIGGGGITTLVAIFVYGRRSQKTAEEAQKAIRP